MLKTGDKAPDFTLVSDEGKNISLKDFRGKKVVLYFYPKDDTEACTQEACDFRDNIKVIEKNDTVVLGVSKDNTRSHVKFKKKYTLPFTMLSDETRDMLDAYGVWKEKSMFGKKYMGIVRTTFLIDEKGIIKNIWEKVTVKGHIEEIISRL